jgi:hypothetical protein
MWRSLGFWMWFFKLFRFTYGGFCCLFLVYFQDICFVFCCSLGTTAYVVLGSIVLVSNVIFLVFSSEHLVLETIQSQCGSVALIATPFIYGLMTCGFLC